MRSGKHFTTSLRVSITFCFLMAYCSLFAQEVRVNAGFVSDSVRIGEPVGFFLSARYPSQLNVLFPDSAFGFNPFEYNRKIYFPTSTADSLSYDSAVYYLSTFEIDEIQYLNLPVFVATPKDCTIVESPRDSIYLIQLVTANLDSIALKDLPLQMNTAYVNVPMEFNYWILIFVLAALLVLGAIVFFVFGKQIRTYFKVRSLRKRHQQFAALYENLIRDLRQSPSGVITENALSAWKKYMEQLESHPFTKLTTKETYALIQDENLKTNLRTIDTAIYGHQRNALDALSFLKGFADQRFTRKLEEVKLGR